MPKMMALDILDQLVEDYTKLRLANRDRICHDCRATTSGAEDRCANCGSEELIPIILYQNDLLQQEIEAIRAQLAKAEYSVSLLVGAQEDFSGDEPVDPLS